MAGGPAAAGRLGVVEIYRRSLKPSDLRFNNWVCRPVAALVVYLLRPTAVTPNQVTFLSLLVALIGDATLLFCPGRVGLAMAALLLYISFVFDCADGQLARIKGQSSPVGAYLDFLMDEIKAVALIAAVAVRLSTDLTALPLLPQQSPGLGWLLGGLFGVVVAASGCSVTTFMRRPEYFEAVHGQPAERVPGFTALRPIGGQPAPAATGVKRLILAPVRLLEWLGKLALHYPAWFYIPALLGRLEWFFVPYVVAHTLYLGRSGLVILLKLGRPIRPPIASPS
jgi:phosphatidylglycerophosphate synthase